MKNFRDIFYTFWFKTILFIVVGTFVWISASSALEILTLHLSNPTAVINAIKQGKNYDYTTSQYVDDEIKKAIDNIVNYSFVYQDVTNFTYPTTIVQRISEETRVADKQIESTKYLAGYYVENKTVDKDYINFGFIKLTAFDYSENAVLINGDYFIQSVDEAAIEKFYQKQRDENIETAKISMDSNYREITSYLSEMKGVKFAVYNESRNETISNIDAVDKNASNENLISYFRTESQDMVVVENMTDALIFGDGSMTDYDEYVMTLLNKDSDKFDLYISFPKDRIISQECLSYVETHNETYHRVVDEFAEFVIFAVIAVVGFVFLMLLSGKHEYKGKVKYALSDKLPNDIHFILHGIVAVSVFALFDNSILMIMNNQDSNNWLSISNDLFILQAKLSVFVAYCTFVAMFSAFKRQIKNKSVISNTAIYKWITAEKNKDNSEHKQ